MIEEMTLGGLLRLGVALLVSTLPARWRARYADLPLVTGTWLSGAAEIVGALLVAGRGFDAYRLAHAPDARAAAHFGNAEGFAFGATLYFGFLVSFVGVACVWLFLEGLLRVVGGIMNEEVGTTLGWLAARATALASAALRRAPPPTPWIDDTVTHEGETRTIASCRRRAWDAATTIEIDGVFYGVAAADEQTGGERPFRYRLTPLPATGAIRKLVRYDPTTDPTN
jgi:hypothetical protein